MLKVARRDSGRPETTEVRRASLLHRPDFIDLHIALACLVSVLMFLNGCSSSSIISQVDPRASSNRLTANDAIVVASPGLGFRWQRTFEEEGCRALERRGYRALPYTTLFFPEREYGTEEYARIMRKNGIKAVLFFSVSNLGSVESYMPRNELNGVEYGGYDISKPWANFDASLFIIEVSGSSPVWIASIETAGNAFMSIESLIGLAASSIAKRLQADGVLR